MAFKRISALHAKELIDTHQTNIIDIRDAASFTASHINGAVHIHNENVESYAEATDPEKPLLIYCYHGNSSLGAADFFAQKGFKNVYSIDGGYAAWHMTG